MQHFVLLNRIISRKKNKMKNVDRFFRMEVIMKKLFVAAVLLVAALGIFTVPASAKKYEENGFTYSVKNKEATLKLVKVDVKDLVIPNTLGGFPVTKIGSRALCPLNGAKRYQSIKIPDSVTYIDWCAFADSDDLKTIKLPKSLKSVGSSAFAGCDRLETVEFNDGLRTIENGAFEDCVSLKKVDLPDSLKTIESAAFDNCYKLSSVKLGRNTKEIGGKAFHKAYKLKSITIPKNVKTIGDKAFQMCEDLQKVTFQNNKTKLGNGVFYKCTSLQKAILPKGIKNIPEYTFYQCEKLKSVTLSKNVSIIKKRAFYGCSSLRSVKLNKKVYAIGDRAFAESGLRKITLNKNMQFIGNGAFMGTKIHSLKLPNKVTFIGSKVFANCKKLRSIQIPASVTGINPGAFNNCVSLRAINVAGANKNYSSSQGVLYNKEKTYLIQYPLHKASKSFRVPSSVKKIRTNAFANNSYLTNVTSGAEKISDFAFNNMESLRTVTLLSGTRKIGYCAFAENTNLRKVTIPDSVTYIGNNAFYRTMVKRIHIPSNLRKLGYSAFTDCNNLTAFEGGNGSKYKVEDGVLYNGRKTNLIKYPAKKATKHFVVPDSVKIVQSEAFAHAKNLTKLEFGKKVTKIRYNAIYKAKNLKSIIINSKKLSYSSIGAISECNKLAVIVGPNNYIMQAMADNAMATLITL